jgi:rubrerythrin
MEKTIKNLAAAFIGESQARNRYTTYSKIAKKEGYEQISAIFAETADQEAEHAKWLMRLINDLKDKGADASELKVDGAEVPTVVGTTLENLKAAADGEHHENTSMYPEFAKIAKEEGLDSISDRLLAIARAENHHEERYRKLIANIEAETVFKKSEEKAWICRKCGYEHHGAEAPEECPACGHPQGYYQVKEEEYN